MTHARKLAAGNWKMNGFKPDLAEVKALATAYPSLTCDVLICPPATLISRMAEVLADSPISVGGQDCTTGRSGAHTGDISAAMLEDAGASHVILGHSERRTDHGETDALVNAKTLAALGENLTPIICIGETLDQREAGETLDVVGAQMAGSVPNGVDPAHIVIAYEPVWAIGTGKVATLEQIAEVHSFMRDALVKRFNEAGQATPLLYGGSVKPSNAADIFGIENVDGALVGGASLKAADFGGIIDALASS